MNYAFRNPRAVRNLGELIKPPHSQAPANVTLSHVPSAKPTLQSENKKVTQPRLKTPEPKANGLGKLDRNHFDPKQSFNDAPGSVQVKSNVPHDDGKNGIRETHRKDRRLVEMYLKANCGLEPTDNALSDGTEFGLGEDHDSWDTESFLNTESIRPVNYGPATLIYFGPDPVVPVRNYKPLVATVYDGSPITSVVICDNKKDLTRRGIKRSAVVAVKRDPITGVVRATYAVRPDKNALLQKMANAKPDLDGYKDVISEADRLNDKPSSHFAPPVSRAEWVSRLPGPGRRAMKLGR